jgi:hypothetical protein
MFVAKVGAFDLDSQSAESDYATLLRTMIKLCNKYENDSDTLDGLSAPSALLSDKLDVLSEDDPRWTVLSNLYELIVE